MPAFRFAVTATLSILAAAAAAALCFVVAAPAAAQPAQLVIQVWSFGFGPQPIRLAAGKPVTLTFANQSGSSHDFVAPGFFQHARIIAGSARMDMIDLRAHETKSITLVPAAGTYQAHCSHFLHKQMGMSDTIIVN
jgi:plastocyanin